ncbi:MAG TPA: carbohydrate-binding family 9-like protein [Polyangiaceae bacterium]|jgi:hypothetical protein|nr:carbohydrate-binding family 9-like protein [Polyangiaceae bacterium]HOD24047.1 carbohydrate-binding family 9-like protein [Polyangiaceae bacterium]HOE51908.1 carbohydrate-binding family 9-like protein [Polyangiaceae bacterium]HOH00420.1 carbohydrate-binding family 9-like protein [Polyangiaceae bacterium]HOR37783.1 carbohydrate-binding family 9-like protein [Polyangiaceae bacterium]
MKRFHRLTTIAFLTIASVGFGCVGGSKSSQANPEALKQYILEAPPSDIPHKLNAVFEGKAKLIGYRVSPEKEAKPGSEIKLTMYWECLDNIESGWNLFTHVFDANDNRILNIDNVGPLRQWVDNKQVLAPSSWKKGKVYVDEQVFSLPDKLDTHEIVITTGIWKEEARLKITSGPHDRENRAIVARLSTGISRKPKPFTGIKSLRVDKLAKGDTITIDGKLDEEAWKKAASTGPFVDVGTGEPNASFPVQGSARLTWDDSFLYVAFEVQSATIVGGFPNDAKDPHLWEKDTVEIMIDPDGDGDNKDYYEIQINPQNLVFDTQYDSYNQPKDDSKGMFGNMDWSAKLKSAVVVEGEMDAPDKGKGYVVEAKIPWASFSKANQSPPKPGNTWRMNFYAMKNNSGVAWSPILGQGNFHRAARFGRIVWAVPGEPLPASSTTPTSSISALPPARLPPMIPPRQPPPPPKP